MSANVISKDEAVRKISADGVFIIDARPEDVYTEDSDQIVGAIHLPKAIMQEIFGCLPKDREYIVYAAKEDEGTSKDVANFLADKGYTTYVLHGGYEDWRDSTLPIEPINARGTPLL